MINRAQQMLGQDAVYVPGWDCHGLPIEWKIEEEYRAKKTLKDEVPILEFRKECRDFAAHWIDVQREEFQRLGVLGDWAHPYTTMEFPAEAQIVREIGKFLMNGGLYKGVEAGDVVGGREDRARRGRDRISRPHLDAGLGEVSGGEAGADQRSQAPRS